MIFARGAINIFHTTVYLMRFFVYLGNIFSLESYWTHHYGRYVEQEAHSEMCFHRGNLKHVPQVLLFTELEQNQTLHGKEVMKPFQLF